MCHLRVLAELSVEGKDSGVVKIVQVAACLACELLKQNKDSSLSSFYIYLSFFSKCSETLEEGNVTIAASTQSISIPLQIIKMVTLTTGLHLQWTDGRRSLDLARSDQCPLCFKIIPYVNVTNEFEF